MYNFNTNWICMVKTRGTIMEEIKRIKKTIVVDPEFLDVLDRLEEKVKKATWDGVDKLSKRELTKILARKINSSKLI